MEQYINALVQENGKILWIGTLTKEDQAQAQELQ